jgi:2'-5' RNA ligase
MRLFVAIKPSHEVQSRLADTIERLRPRAPLARWVDPEALHVTLAFLGEDEVAGLAQQELLRIPRLGHALERAVSEYRRFEVHAVGLGTFGALESPRVLWAGIVHREGDTLSRLHADVAAALEPLGVAPDARVFTPHITLARARAPGGDPALAACAVGPPEDYGTTPSDTLLVYSSQPGRPYGVIAVLPYGYRTSDS